MKKYDTVKISHTSHIPPCGRNNNHFLAHPWLCVLVVCRVLRAPVVLLDSHAYAQKNGKPWPSWDCKKGLFKTNQLIAFYSSKSVGFNEMQ